MTRRDFIFKYLVKNHSDDVGDVFTESYPELLAALDTFDGTNNAKITRSKLYNAWEDYDKTTNEIDLPFYYTPLFHFVNRTFVYNEFGMNNRMFHSFSTRYNLATDRYYFARIHHFEEVFLYVIIGFYVRHTVKRIQQCHDVITHEIHRLAEQLRSMINFKTENHSIAFAFAAIQYIIEPFGKKCFVCSKSTKPQKYIVRINYPFSPFFDTFFPFHIENNVCNSCVK